MTHVARTIVTTSRQHPEHRALGEAALVLDTPFVFCTRPSLTIPGETDFIGMSHAEYTMNGVQEGWTVKVEVVLPGTPAGPPASPLLSYHGVEYDSRYWTLTTEYTDGWVEFTAGVLPEGAAESLEVRVGIMVDPRRDYGRLTVEHMGGAGATIQTEIGEIFARGMLTAAPDA